MADRCATVAEFLAIVPEFASLGEPATTTLFGASQFLTTTGQTITIEDLDPDPFPVLLAEVYAPGTDWAAPPYADLETMATLVAAGITARSAIVTAEAVGEIVYLTSTKIGESSVFRLTSPLARGIYYPDLNDASPQTFEGTTVEVSFALETACSMLNAGCWGVKKSNASIFLAAHFLTIAAGGGEVGPVTRKKIDKIEVTFAAATAATADAFGSTKWGRMYLALKSTLFVAPIAARYWGFYR